MTTHGLVHLAGLVALMPAMTGPLPIEGGSNALMLAICGGGRVEIAIDRGEGKMPGLAMTPCCAKGCRNSERRRSRNCKA